MASKTKYLEYNKVLDEDPYETGTDSSPKIQGRRRNLSRSNSRRSVFLPDDVTFTITRGTQTQSTLTPFATEETVRQLSACNTDVLARSEAILKELKRSGSVIDNTARLTTTAVAAILRSERNAIIDTFGIGFDQYYKKCQLTLADKISVQQTHTATKDNCCFLGWLLAFILILVILVVSVLILLINNGN